MNRDPNRYDDAVIEQLVRDAAGDWSMPPVRLDAPSWRDRIRSPRARRLQAAGGWFGRVGRAATAAITLTVTGALVAVLITHPPQNPANGPGQSGATPSAASGKATNPPTTPLPRLLPTGIAPTPSVVVMRTERGDFARVDLRTGTIDGPLTGKGGASRLLVDSSGSMTCLCVAESGSNNGRPTDNTVTLERYDLRGKLQSSTPIAAFSGEPDPRDAGKLIPEVPAHVQTAITFSPDGTYAYVGWSIRAHPVWHSGIVVVDVVSGAITDRLGLPDATDGAGEARRVAGAPRVVGEIGDGKVAIARDWYEWSPADSQNPMYDMQVDVFTAAFDRGAFADLGPAVNADGCGDEVERAGPLHDGGFWMACTKGGAALTVVRRFHDDGSLEGDVRIWGSEGIDIAPIAVSPDGAFLFTWDPEATLLTRVDLATGDQESGRALAAAAPGPFAGLGEWLAPAVAAKSLLDGALLISPDGSRIYALGIKGVPSSGGSSSSSSGGSGSAGIFVFDAKTLKPTTIWDPYADYVSLASSGDGHFIYAAGLPGVDFAGRPMVAQGASIVVLDTSDGSVRTIAGQLGGEMLTFMEPILP